VNQRINSSPLAAKTWAVLSAQEAVRLRYLFVDTRAGGNLLSAPQGLNHLLNAARQAAAEVIVLDPLYSFAPGLPYGFLSRDTLFCLYAEESYPGRTCPSPCPRGLTAAMHSSPQAISSQPPSLPPSAFSRPQR
jgi:hypothetical protein